MTDTETAEPQPGTFWERGYLQRFADGETVISSTVRQQVGALLNELAEPTPGDLTPEQAQRVNALREARDVLIKKSGSVFSSNVELEVIDLHSIATFILTGKDPWQPLRPVKKRRWRRG